MSHQFNKLTKISVTIERKCGTCLTKSSFALIMTSLQLLEVIVTYSVRMVDTFFAATTKHNNDQRIYYTTFARQYQYVYRITHSYGERTHSAARVREEERRIEASTVNACMCAGIECVSLCRCACWRACDDRIVCKVQIHDVLTDGLAIRF